MITKGTGDSSFSSSSDSSSSSSEDSEDGKTPEEIEKRAKEKEARKEEVKVGVQFTFPDGLQSHALDKFDPKADLDFSLPYYLLPFYICLTNSTGTDCRLCDRKSCTGCRLKPSDDPVGVRFAMTDFF